MFQTILAGIDGSRRTQAIMEATTDLALATGASVHILCAIDPAYFLDELDGEHPSRSDELDYPAAAMEREGADALVRKVTLELHAKGVEAVCSVVGGEPVQTLLSAARQFECDAIILGHRHLSRLGRLTGRSICHEILEKSPIPVFIIPADYTLK